LAGEEKRARERAADLERRLAQFDQDSLREGALIADAAEVMAGLAGEDEALVAEADRSEDFKFEADERRALLEQQLAGAEAALAEAQAVASDLNARRNALGAALAEEARRFARFESECAGVERERAALQAASAEDAVFHADRDAAEELAEAFAMAEEEALAAEAAHAEAREAEARRRGPLADAEGKAQRLDTEARTLMKLLGSGASGPWPPVVDAVNVARGFEAALGAALGDDLDASIDAAAPSHWAELEPLEADPELPPGVEALAARVEAPAALRRRLAQIGVVSSAEGARLAALLRPGQRLVSREGDLWRWDGFVATAEAPTPAANRLVERNRLVDLSREAEAARQEAQVARADAARAQAALHEAAHAETAARQRARTARGALDAARDKLAATERRRAQTLSRISALDEALARARGARDEAADRKARVEAALKALAPSDELALTLERARSHAAQARAEFAEAKAAAASLAREAEARAARRLAIAAERKSWVERGAKAQAHVGEIAERRLAAQGELDGLAEAPAAFLAQRRELASLLETAEAERKAASDARALAETELAEADRGARATLEAMGAAREARAASEERLEGARQSRETLLRAILADLDVEPSGLAALGGLAAGAEPPAADIVERKLEGLKQERERLGAVNLRADEELAEVTGSRERLVAERDDLTEAIKRLRQAIHNLNQEGRERLLAAFEVVNKHFGELFATLFEGGSAELQLIESDDPLEAGLELLAKPPGKKPQTLTLLSGGEQALTAMALIFAVFLTNPSPICVLDEVDAPLDDYNVERFCDLLDEMRRRSDTRFVTITHNPITMARMDRLFGVTMAERGVSQIVSVDLAEAERFLEAS